MANFTRVKPFGWSLNEIYTSAQANQLDIDHAASVNGDGGGTYAGDLVWQGLHTFDGSSAGIAYRQSTLGDADATIDVSVDTYWFESSPASVPRTITLNHSSSPAPVAGQRIKVAMTIVSGVADVIFEREDATELARISAGGNGGSVEFEYTSGGWICIGASEDGTFTVPH